MLFKLLIDESSERTREKFLHSAGLFVVELVGRFADALDAGRECMLLFYFLKETLE
jgi:hypothetical protein